MATSTIPSSAASRPFRIGLLGGGVVGGGVYELVQRHKCLGKLKGVEIAKICVRDLHKPRDFTINSSMTTLTTNPEELWNDPSIDCIVEVMGGTTLAATAVHSALRANKAVVTANKALVAAELDALNALAVSTRTPLLFEAAVCGGIPIIHCLKTCYAGDSIRKIAGICNGTTNYMLEKMEAGEDYAAALKEAQDLGYAEADPTADVEGHDVRAKICLLAKLGFGTTINQQDISCRGISQLTVVDFAHAQSMNSTIKLLGVAQQNRHSNALSAYVAPHIVSSSHALAAAKGSGNIVVIDSENMGLCTYTGPGAGRYPTANSIVADVFRLASQFHRNNGKLSLSSNDVEPPFPFHTEYPIDTDFEHDGAWYVRLDENHDITYNAAVLEDAAAKVVGVKVIQMSQGFLNVASCRHSKIQAFCQAIGSTMYMPIL